MSADYPYMVSNNKIKPILDSILAAAKPQKFSHEFLKKLGYGSSNDRAIIPLLKGLGFINENGAPAQYYDDLKDETKRFYVLADRIKDLYQDLYSLNEEIHNAPEEEIKGSISRVTGKDSTSVSRYYATFKTLISIAKFNAIGKREEYKKEREEKEVTNQISKKEEREERHHYGLNSAFHYNIQIHLPATTDISVYNAIFKSLKENLLA